MQDTKPPTVRQPPASRPGGGPRPQGLIVAALLALAAVLAFSSLLGDSITYDETSHLTAGMSYLKTGDFRLARDHPPLAKIWAAWPLLFVQHAWPSAEHHGWQIADVFLTGRTWLFELNDGERMLPIARGMIVILLLALCGTIYAIGRRLFGLPAARLALVLAVLSPMLLAHGRLVTTDLPITLCVALTLLTFARLLERVTVTRLLATAAALGAASVTKLSWPLVLPAMFVMGIAAILRREPIEIPARGGRDSKAAQLQAWRPLVRRRDRVATIATVAVLLAATTLASIWTCYGWRVSMFPEPTPEELAAGHVDDSVEQLAKSLGPAWFRALHDEQGEPRRGVVPAFIRVASEWHLLPDAYLFGLAWTLQTTSGRNAYFCGETSTGGWWAYFPVAFVIKTPIATMVLLLAGIAALVWRRHPYRSPERQRRDRTASAPTKPVANAPGSDRAARRMCLDVVLLAGLAAYVVIHVAYVMSSSFNIGHRHLLPIYPAVLVLAGASVAWLETRIGRWLVGAAVVWLAAANLWIHPHYLSYFNELIGGPHNGHRYLADSNIDWGQDLKRLARFAREHPGETIKLSYFGSADPTKYGFDCDLLPSSIDTGSPEHLDGGGLYVISVTHLLGVYDPLAQDSFWQSADARQTYRALGPLVKAPPEEWDQRLLPQRDQLIAQYPRMRWGRFLYNLRRRPPDERVGCAYSLFVYRLSQAEIDELTRP